MLMGELSFACMTLPAWPQLVQARPTRIFLNNFAHWNLEREKQCVGVEDFKYKSWELSAGHVFHHMEEDSLKKEWSQNSETKEEF